MSSINLDEAFAQAEAEQRVMREYEAQVAIRAEAWRKMWPAHCAACRGWGGHTFRQSHGRGLGSEQMFEPCDALGPEFCHRCGYEGFDEDHEGLSTVSRGYQLARCCYWCKHADDDGEPSAW